MLLANQLLERTRNAPFSMLRWPGKVERQSERKRRTSPWRPGRKTTAEANKMPEENRAAALERARLSAASSGQVRGSTQLDREDALVFALAGS